ncbi:Crp/Fnr family transcriptional regulator [Pseudogemmobacter sonorensis]|uniref:Crp/Fnr family transcriptional regulator n=1 Tax=Pseudogemmobacter sonorensis TaxID=2989681 RepID=UPI003699EAA2
MAQGAPGIPDPKLNQLLSCLGPRDWQLIAPHLQSHVLFPGDVLHKAGDEVTHSWFPCGPASAGFQIGDENGNAPVAVATIGREGAVGGIVSNGRVPAYTSAEVRDGGPFFSIRTAQLESLKALSVDLRHWFARYSDCLLAQILQNAACNARHTIRQRAARWLLDAAARTGGAEIRLTQEQLAMMLGVGRTFLTRTVRELRESGLVATRRGVFILKDEPALRAAACTCSSHVADHYREVMGGIYSHPANGGR